MLSFLAIITASLGISLAVTPQIRLLASIDRAQDILGYAPRTPFRQGLTNTIQWFRNHWDEITASASFEPGMSSAVRAAADIKDEHVLKHRIQS